MTSTETPALQINAHSTSDGTSAQAVEFFVEFALGADADRDALLALFPKSASLKASTLGYLHESGWTTVPTITGRANLIANGVNGGKNETGIRRYHSILRAAKKAGIEVSWGIPGRSFRTDYPTQQAFEEAIA